MRIRSQRKFVAAFLTASLLAAAFPALTSLASPALAAKASAPVPADTVALMRAKGMAINAPVLVRVFKRESELEIWKQQADGRYARLKTFPVCRWSGRLGPKRQNGDRQSPEGFYDITPKLMNPNSSYHLSFDTGFPNAYDRAHGYTGSYLMVHGACSSMGCYAMTDDGVEEIFALMRDAFKGGQRAVQFQAYPFRMTAKNMARMRDDPDIDFWRQLKIGHDRFEATAMPPTASVTGKRYSFLPYKDRRVEAAAIARLYDEKVAIQQQVDDGAPSVRITYADGGMHPHFARMRNRTALGIISRPEALALAGRDIIIHPGIRKAPVVMMASTSGASSLTFAQYWERPGLKVPSPALQASPETTTPVAARIAMAHGGATGGAAGAIASDATGATGAMHNAPSWSRMIVAMASPPALP